MIDRHFKQKYNSEDSTTKKCLGIFLSDTHRFAINFTTRSSDAMFRCVTSLIARLIASSRASPSL